MQRFHAGHGTGRRRRGAEHGREDSFQGLPHLVSVSEASRHDLVHLQIFSQHFDSNLQHEGVWKGSNALCAALPRLLTQLSSHESEVGIRCDRQPQAAGQRTDVASEKNSSMSVCREQIQCESAKWICESLMSCSAFSHGFMTHLVERFDTE